jgi:hypothetical protein
VTLDNEVEELIGARVYFMKESGSTVAAINLFLAALLVLAVAGWSFIQKGCHAYFQGEADAFFQKIEGKEVQYRNINNKYLPFTFEESAKALKELKLDPKGASYYDFSAQQTEGKGLRIIAQLKPEILKRWYLHNPKTELRLVYEKMEGQKGKRVQ